MGVDYPNQVMVIDLDVNHLNIINSINCMWKNNFTSMDPFEFYTQYLAINKLDLAIPYQNYENLDFSLSKGLFTSIGSIENIQVGDEEYWVFKLNPTGPVNYKLSIY